MIYMARTALDEFDELLASCIAARLQTHQTPLLSSKLLDAIQQFENISVRLVQSAIDTEDKLRTP